MKVRRKIKRFDTRVFSDFELRDSDGDGVYDVFDCNPYDKKMQDDFYKGTPEASGPSGVPERKEPWQPPDYYSPMEVRKRLNALHILEGSKY